MKIRPLHDRVIVKRIEEERKSAGGIVIPDTAAEKPEDTTVNVVLSLEAGETLDADLTVDVEIGSPIGEREVIDGERAHPVYRHAQAEVAGRAGAGGGPPARVPCRAWRQRELHDRRGG